MTSGNADVTVRRAGVEDVPLVVQWRRDAARWLASKGTDQWSDVGLSLVTFERRVVESVQSGGTWMVEVQGVPCGTVAVDSQSDQGLWSAGELAEAVVVHRMMVSRHAPRRGLGDVLLATADAVAVTRGKRWVRLDAWTSNRELHSYYERRGFEHVRTVPGFVSGALFQRRVLRCGMLAGHG